jgi:aspartate carbamoyltransferase catalytic subunit
LEAPKLKDFISIRDMDRPFIEKMLKKADKMLPVYKKRESLESLKGKVVATLFFEPSTRTRLSFETAAARLSSGVVTFSKESSSQKKGESFHDTIKTVEQYADCIVLRHPLEGTARYAAEISEVPIVNGGDGANQHPTQTLLDLFTMKSIGDIDKLKVALVGDLKYARVMHSLYFALSMFDSEVVLSSPEQLRMPKDLTDEVEGVFGKKADYQDIEDIDCDILYTCRIQKERFMDENELRRVRSSYRITRDVVKEALLMHPLPKVDEIHPEVEASENAIYFPQAGYGIPMRMAILEEALR